MPVTEESLLTTKQEDAYAFIVKIVHDHQKLNRLIGLSKYGFDLYIPDVVSKYLLSTIGPESAGAHPIPKSIAQKTKNIVYQSFFDAAWQMCLRGILRPTALGAQQLSPGEGYCFTAEGHSWFKDGNLDNVVWSTGRIGDLLAEHNAKFGEGFAERSQEAVVCLNTRAFVACCAMCGAAAESILLKLAIEKENDEQRVLDLYSKPQGRSAVESLIFAGKKAGLVSRVKSRLELLKYWRDQSAHGVRTSYDDVEATAALNHLLKFAQICTDHWVELTT